MKYTINFKQRFDILFGTWWYFFRIWNCIERNEMSWRFNKIISYNFVFKKYLIVAWFSMCWIFKHQNSFGFSMKIIHNVATFVFTSVGLLIYQLYIKICSNHSLSFLVNCVYFIPQKYSMVIAQYPKYLYLIGLFFRNKKTQ